MSQQIQTDVNECIVSVSKSTKTSSFGLFVQIACSYFYASHACHWERHGKNSLQTVSSCVPSLMHVFVKHLFSSMYRLLVPAHILSTKRALYHQCSWFVSGWWHLQTCLQSLFLLLLFILLSVILFIFYSKWMCIICLEAFLLSHKARCPHHHHHISWSSYVSPVCIRHTHPLTKPLSRSGPFPQLCFNHTCAPPFNTHTHADSSMHTHTHHDHYH